MRPAATAGRARPAPANAPPVTLGGAAVLAVARLTDGVLVLVDDVLGGDAALNASAVMVAERLLGFGPLTPAERAAMFSPLLDYLPATPRSLLQGYGRLRASVDAGRGADAPAAEAPLALVYVPPFGVAGVGGGGRGGGGPDVAGRAVMRREAPAPDAGRRRRQALEAGATVVDAAAAPYQPGDIPTTTTQAVPEGDAFAAVWIGADPVASAAARGVVAVGGRQGGEVHAASSTSPRTPATWPLPTNVTRPADDAALAFLPVLHLAALLRARTLTSTELTEVYLERLARWAGVGGFGVWGACAGWTGRCGLGGRGRLGRRGAGRACRRPPGAQTALTPPRAPQPSCSCPTTGPAPTLGPTHPAEHGGAGLACRVSVPTLPAPGHPRYHHPPSLLPFTNHSATPPPPPPPCRYDATLEAVVTLTPDLARAQAAAADAELDAGAWRGPLHGIPYGLKDVISLAGYPTTWGAARWHDRVVAESAGVVHRLDAAGAVHVAKLATGELAFDDVWWGGQVKNPWNIAQGASGSSAGPAAAVVAGLVAFALGTETQVRREKGEGAVWWRWGGSSGVGWSGRCGRWSSVGGRAGVDHECHAHSGLIHRYGWQRVGRVPSAGGRGPAASCGEGPPTHSPPRPQNHRVGLAGVACRARRSDGAAPHIWPGRPVGRHAAGRLSGQSGPHLPHRRRLCRRL